MQINIGSKIKTLRKNAGITQEQLAKKIGVSFQAVSKWENNIALPDITLVPVLANFFEISTDELLSYNTNDKEVEIKNIVCKASEHRETDPDTARKILEQGLKKYPDNDILLNNMLYITNYSKYPDETIAISLKLINKTASDEIKYDALRFLA